MNQRNTAVKRIHADVKELKTHPSSRYHAVPLEDNIFEWHFTIRGPPGTDFEGGIYHGRILLSPEYPFKPPHIIFLTKNGRFEVGTRICLSISAYHPEHWQPAWGVRTMLEAIISFLPTPGSGAIGALDWTPKERKKLAMESHSYTCPVCGSIDDLIELPEDSEEVQEESMQQQVSQLHVHGLGDSEGKPAGGGGGEDIKAETPTKCSGDADEIEEKEPESSETEITTTATTPAATSPISVPQHAPPRALQATPTQPPDTAVGPQQQQTIATATPPARDLVDEILFWAMTVVGLAIFYILLRRFNRSVDGAGQDL